MLLTWNPISLVVRFYNGWSHECFNVLGDQHAESVIGASNSLGLIWTDLASSRLICGDLA